MTVLVVDDDDDVREGLQSFLEAEGHSTHCAANGREALSLLRAEPEPPRLILLDLMMPVMSGWEVLVELDVDPLWREIPVAIMSAHPCARGGRAARGVRLDEPLGAMSRMLLPKPLDLSKLLAIARAASA
jgi:two-component system, chemotaxis family, chemotaxis protein CheY